MPDPIIIVSNDGHMSAPLEMYKPYMETKYHAALDELSKEDEQYKSFNRTISAWQGDSVASDGHGDPFSPERQRAGYDVKARMNELDRQGVAAEIVFPATQFDITPWFHSENEPYSAELRQVGGRAYHRWMADCIVESEGRIAGVADPGPCLDMQDTVKDLQWLANNGFVGVSCPGTIVDPALPGLHDKYYEPFWAACSDLGLQLIVHNWGWDQGEMFELGYKLEKLMTDDVQGMPNELISRMDDDFAIDLFEKTFRVTWLLIFSGVFDRYPGLKVIPTEANTDWIPGMLSYLDRIYDNPGSILKSMLTKRPSEYWESNGLVGATFVRPAEIEVRHQIGVEQMLFGMDYPHAEGTWPNNLDWIRAAFKGVPESEARLILGENAISTYHLDREKLRAIAQRIGPRPEDVLGDHFVEPALIKHFHQRGGFLNPIAPFREAKWGPVINRDITQFAT